MAIFDVSSLPKQMVVRPSGTWDTRAPFHYFLAIYKREMRAYALSAMVNDRMDGDLLAARSAGKTLEEFLVAEGGHSAKRYWRDYKLNQTETNLEGVIKGPIYSDTRHDLIAAQELLRRSSVISTFSLFEAYAHSWALNYLLARAESSFAWTKPESELALALSPVHGSKVSPNISKVITSIDSIPTKLRDIDANGRNRKDSKYIDSGFTLLDSLNFWRGFRNTLVHNRGFCTPKLYEREQEYWQACLSEFKRDVFSERARLTVSSELLRKCHITIYRSARALEELLFTLSGERRGHPWAPDPKPPEPSLPPKYARRLLRSGDHPLSLRWHSDQSFRDTFKVLPPKINAV